jgi:GNAT superfamily N-acetyltransferase
MNNYAIDLMLVFNEDQVYVGDNGPSSFCYVYDGELALSDEVGEVSENIGTFSATVVNAEASVLERHSLSYLFDHDASIYEYFESLFDPEEEVFNVSVEKAVDGFCILSRNLLIIDSLVVNPEHRGHGVGLVALRALMERLGIGVDIVAMRVAPRQYDSRWRYDLPTRSCLGLDRFDLNQSKATSKLKKHFSRLGFKRLPGNDIMVRSLELPLPPIDSLQPKP